MVAPPSWTRESVLGIHKIVGFFWESNPGPLAQKATIMTTFLFLEKDFIRNMFVTKTLAFEKQKETVHTVRYKI